MPSWHADPIRSFDHSLVPDLQHWIALRSEVAVFSMCPTTPDKFSCAPWECRRWKRIKVFIRALNPENNVLKFLCQNADRMREVTLIGALLLRCGAPGTPAHQSPGQVDRLFHCCGFCATFSYKQAQVPALKPWRVVVLADTYPRLTTEEQWKYSMKDVRTYEDSPIIMHQNSPVLRETPQETNVIP